MSYGVAYNWHGVKLTEVHPGSGPPEKHEEEYERFMEILDRVQSPEPVMIELGSFWCLWTILFKKRFPRGRAIIVEQAFEPQIKTGLMNLHLNSVAATIHYAEVNTNGKNGTITIEEVIKQNNLKAVDVLHMDIQGMEYNLRKSINNMLRSGQVKNLLMATHNDKHNKEMVKLFSEHIVHSHCCGNRGRDGEIIVESKK